MKKKWNETYLDVINSLNGSDVPLGNKQTDKQTSIWFKTHSYIRRGYSGIKTVALYVEILKLRTNGIYAIERRMNLFRLPGRGEIIIHRLRIGHTYLMHGHSLWAYYLVSFCIFYKYSRWLPLLYSNFSMNCRLTCNGRFYQRNWIVSLNNLSVSHCFWTTHLFQIVFNMSNLLLFKYRGTDSLNCADAYNRFGLVWFILRPCQHNIGLYIWSRMGSSRKCWYLKRMPRFLAMWRFKLQRNSSHIVIVILIL